MRKQGSKIKTIRKTINRKLNINVGVAQTVAGAEVVRLRPFRKTNNQKLNINVGVAEW